MSLHLLNTIANGEVADASPVQSNYKQIQDYINTEVITRDGAVAMQAPLQLQGGASEDNSAASKEYVNSFLPVGIMVPWPAPSPPGGGHWMLCNGAALSVAAYPELYGVLGTRYGAGTGTFLLPNLTGRTMFGFDSAQAAFNTIGKAGGSFTVPVPPHAHPMSHSHPMQHTHEMPHVHSIAHNHDAFDAPIDNATVATSVRDNSTAGTTNSFMSASGVGITGSHTDNPVIGGTANVNVPPYAGNSGQPDDATTDAASIDNTSSSSLVNTANNTLPLTPTTIATTQIQPYVVVNFVIRVL